MGRIDVGVKCIQVRSLIEKRAYKEACEVADTIDIDKVTSIVDLKVIASVYERLERYDEAKDILLRSYERKPTKMVVYRLAYLSVKTKEFEDAEFFYQEFSNMAPNSPDRYILRYGIDRAKGVDYYLRIATLQRLKQISYMEEWGYELAKVYHKAGLYEECIRECKDLITWFGTGVIVEKAQMLCQYHEQGKEALDAYGVFDEGLSPEELVSRREQFISDTQDLRSQTARIQQEQEKREIRKQLDRDLEKTVDLRQVLQEEGEDLDLLQQSVHRVWGEPVSQVHTEAVPKRKHFEPVGEMHEVTVPQTPEEVIAASLAEVLTEEEKGNEPEYEPDWKNSDMTLEEMMSETSENIPEIVPGEQETEESMFQSIEEATDALEENDMGDVQVEAVLEEVSENIEMESEIIQEDYGEAVSGFSADDVEEPEDCVVDSEPDMPQAETEEILDEAEENTQEEEDTQEEVLEENTDEEDIQEEALEENTEEVEMEIPAYVQRETKEELEVKDQKDEKKAEGGKRGLKQFFARRKKKKAKKNKDEKKTVKKSKKNKKETVDSFEQTEPLEFVGEPYIAEKESTSSSDVKAEEEVAKESIVVEKTNIQEEFSVAEEKSEPVMEEEQSGEEEVSQPAIEEEEPSQKEAVQSEMEEEQSVQEEIAQPAMEEEQSSQEETVQPAIEEQSGEEDTEEDIFMSVCGVDLWEYFAAYEHDTRLCQDIDEAFRRMKSGKKPYHMIITCKDQERATKLGKQMAKAMKRLGFMKEQQVARLDAEDLNRRHLEKSYDTLEGKFLLVEHAKNITADTAQSIMNMINERRNHIVVILTDARPYMDDLMNEYKMMRRYFPNDLKMK